jgi:sugar phosphate permease
MGTLGSFIDSYIVGYLNGATGGFSASYIFMASALLLSAFLTIIAVKSSANEKKKRKLKKTPEVVSDSP